MSTGKYCDFITVMAAKFLPSLMKRKKGVNNIEAAPSVSRNI
jgi:hypothetical protein